MSRAIGCPSYKFREAEFCTRKPYRQVDARELFCDDWTAGFQATKDYVVHVERGTPEYLDGAKKEAFPTTYNYERWLTNMV
jgi:hypothetical protein